MLLKAVGSEQLAVGRARLPPSRPLSDEQWADGSALAPPGIRNSDHGSITSLFASFALDPAGGHPVYDPSGSGCIRSAGLTHIFRRQCLQAMHCVSDDLGGALAGIGSPAYPGGCLSSAFGRFGFRYHPIRHREWVPLSGPQGWSQSGTMRGFLLRARQSPDEQKGHAVGDGRVCDWESLLESRCTVRADCGRAVSGGGNLRAPESSCGLCTARPTDAPPDSSTLP